MAARKVGRRLLGGAPELLARGAVLAEQIDAITRDGLVLAAQTVVDIGRAHGRRNRWTAAALWAISGQTVRHNGPAEVQKSARVDDQALSFFRGRRGARGRLRQ